MQEALVVRREAHIPAPPAAVFAFLTDPDKILRWMGTEAQVEPRSGGITSPELVSPAAPSARWCRFTAWPTASAGTAARWCPRGLVWSKSTCWTSSRRERCYASPTAAFPMPSNAPAMRKGGPITSTGWSRLQPDTSQAQTLGMAALAADLARAFCTLGNQTRAQLLSNYLNDQSATRRASYRLRPITSAAAG
jgi:hypothetical protein